jgi:hypothetical protein
MNEELFVVAKSVQQIKDGKMPRLARVKRRRQHHAVSNRAMHKFAGQGIALDAAGRRLQSRRQTQEKG